MNIAHKIKSLDNVRGEAFLFRMEPPLESYDYVVVSAINPKIMEGMGQFKDLFQPETYIFGARPDGTVLGRNSPAVSKAPWTSPARWRRRGMRSGSKHERTCDLLQ